MAPSIYGFVMYILPMPGSRRGHAGRPTRWPPRTRAHLRGARAAGHNRHGVAEREGVMTGAWSATGRLPLAGLVVIDFGQIFQGPYATFLLAKSGADVIKIEPPQGEPLRRRALPEKHATLPFAMLNQ